MVEKYYRKESDKTSIHKKINQGRADFKILTWGDVHNEDV